MPILTAADIVMNNYYISQKRDNNGNVIKEQVVKICGVGTLANGTPHYTGYYGVNGYHEVCPTIKALRAMTVAEQASSVSGKYWELPQQFYQTIPGEGTGI